MARHPNPDHHLLKCACVAHSSSHRSDTMWSGGLSHPTTHCIGDDVDNLTRSFVTQPPELLGLLHFTSSGKQRDFEARHGHPRYAGWEASCASGTTLADG